MSASAQHDLTRTGVYTLLSQRFFERALDLPGVAADGGWTENADGASLVEHYLADWETNRCREPAFEAWLGSKDDATVLIYTENGGRWNVSVAAPSQDEAEVLLHELSGFFPEPVYDADDGTVTVRFWALGPMGPIAYYRRLAAAPWSDVQVNYPGAVRSALSSLMSMGPPDAGGRLMLMHGPPGTGKTHAIRALAQSLAPWCSVDYVIDVDAFFEVASYMISTMVMEDAMPLDNDGPEPWRLVVLEDSGEYLRSDATEKVGLGLGRLLNLADGLVGQGLRIMILMTTNEPADELHPAVTRPGRCMANLKMGPLSAEEGEAWLKGHGVTATLDGEVTLADLYAKLNSIIGEAVAVEASSGHRVLRWTASRNERSHHVHARV